MPEEEEIEMSPDIDLEHVHLKPKPPFPGFGIFIGILSGVLYASSTTMVKTVSVGGIEVAGFRCCVQYLLVLPILSYKSHKKTLNIHGPPGKFKYLLMRGVTGSTAAILLYQSINKISVGDAVTITFTNCIFAAVFGYFMLGEKVTVFDFFFFLIAISGVVMISKPPIIFGGEDYDSNKLAGILYALASAACQGLTFVVLRKLGTETYPLLNIFYYSVIGAIVSTCYVSFPGNFYLPCVNELILIPFIGLFGVLQQTCVTLALRYERTSTIALLRSFQIVMTFILQIIILNDIPTIFSLIGAMLIFVCVFGISARKLYNHLKKNR